MARITLKRSGLWVALLLVATVSQAAPPHEVATIGVSEFSIDNPDSGVTISRSNLTRLLCHDLMERGEARVAWLSPHGADEADMRFELSGSVRWTPADAGQLGMRLTLDLELRECATDSLMRTIQKRGLSLEEASSQILNGVQAMKGELDVTSEPPGAVVEIDGRILGETPLIGIEVVLGTHRSVVRKHGFEVQSRVVFLREGRRGERFILRISPEIAVRDSSEDPGRPAIRMPQAEGTQPAEPDVKPQRAGPPYSDFHLGVAYAYGLPLDEQFRGVIGGSHSVAVGVGVCLGLVRFHGEASYGSTSYGNREPGSAHFFRDYEGRSVGIRSIRCAGISADACLLLPMALTRGGLGVHAYGGLGYKVESILVTPLSAWHSVDGPEVTYRTILDPIAVRNDFTYWTAGVALGPVDIRMRRSIEETHSGWWEASLGLQRVFPRKVPGATAGRARPGPIYRSVGYGLSFAYGLPCDDHLRDSVGACRSVALDLRVSLGRVMAHVECLYGPMDYPRGGSSGRDLFFTDAEGTEIGVQAIRRAGIGVDIGIQGRLGGSHRRPALRPYAGVGYRVESILVQPASEWVSPEGDISEYRLPGDELAVRNDHPYWVVGVSWGVVDTRVKGVFGDHERGWWEVALGFQTVKYFE